jgi:hypothetical protein
MHLIFERGDPDQPLGHALIYFRGNSNAILATYVSVPPIAFDLTSYVPGFLQGAMQGLDLGAAMVATPMPPIPEQVDSVEYLHQLASQRHDDLVFAGAAMLADPMRLASEAAEAAREYADKYQAAPTPQPGQSTSASSDIDASRYSDMNEQQKLNELTVLTGRLRDSLRNGRMDDDIEREMQILAEALPAKYRVRDVIAGARIPGERGQKLAELYLERCFKLYNEEYLDLERIDREIDAIGD